MDQIEEPKEGGSTWELWKTVRDLVKAVNALNNQTVSPDGYGEFKYSDGNVKLVLRKELNEMPIVVCVDGTPQSITFYVKK